MASRHVRPPSALRGLVTRLESQALPSLGVLQEGVSTLRFPLRRALQDNCCGKGQFGVQAGDFSGTQCFVD